MAGIADLDTGTIYWTVYTAKGLNLVKSSQTYMMTVVRPAGFDSIPNAVYLTGSATEGGAALATAIPFNVDSDGVFDLYTSLNSLNKIAKTYGGLGTKYTHDKLLAELSFGFWKFMFAGRQFRAGGSTLLAIFPAFRQIVIKVLFTINWTG